MSKQDYEVRLTEFLTRDVSPRAQKPALIILNQPIADVEILSRLWDHTSYHLCADGGANQLYDLLKAKETTPASRFLPSIIHGDLDSLRDDVRDFYDKQGVLISQDPDQYSTDFGKAIRQVFEAQPSLSDVLVLGTIAGRVDQGIGLLGEMHREQHSTRHPSLVLWLFSESSISFILKKGKTKIHTPLQEGVITRNVGILPVYGPAHVTTQGLEWDVEDWYTSMGGQMSTSNHIVRDEVFITTDAEVLFTVERNHEVSG
ncbi:thiamine pyrophosphokinase [Taxawa tesnikishii (nom. ined.)]|nr:thiamine pyrophosphokinase [Dothideales sp. JES 119]